MEHITERIKDIILLIFAAIAGALAPVHDILQGLLWAFGFNIAMGIIADVHVNKAKFSMRKAFNAVAQVAFYAICAVFLNKEAVFLREPEMGETAIKWLTLIVLYFYLTNIFRNAHLIFPKSQSIALIYEVLSTEIFTRLKKMLGKN
jgi:hypothetical protein